MKSVVRFLAVLFGGTISSTSSGHRNRTLAVEQLGKRELLAADVAVASYEGAVAESEPVAAAPESADLAMIGTVEDLRGVTGGGLGGSTAPVIGAGSLDLPIGPAVAQPDLDAPAAMSAGYGGYGPTVTVDSAVYEQGVYSLSGTINDDDTTDMTITIGSTTVTVVVDPDGDFTADVSGAYMPTVEVIVTDQDGNTDSETVAVN